MKPMSAMARRESQRSSPDGSAFQPRSSTWQNAASRQLNWCLTYPERYPTQLLVGIGLVFALLYAASLVLMPKPDGRIVMGDAVHHYVQLRSAVFDGDLDFRNEYVRLYRLQPGENAGPKWLFEPTVTGHVRNYMPVGPAVAWAPAFLLTSLGVWLAHLTGSAYPLDGYGRWFQAAAGFTGIVAATFGSWLAYLTATELFGKRSAIWATLTIWLASSAVYYSVISPTYSHALSMLAVSGFWFAWVRTLGRQTLRRYLALGGLAGLSALMRWQDGVLLVVLVLEACWHWRTSSFRGVAGRILAAGVGAAIAFIPQMIVWTVLFGRPLTVPQGAGFMRWSDPALLSVLFSYNHGLISWTPVIGVALVGLLLLARRRSLVGLAALIFFAASWFVNAAVADWWGGEAFGARRFLGCYPVFILGFAAVLEAVARTTRFSAAIAAAFISHTFLLLLQYQAFMHGLRNVVPYPGGFTELWIARFRAPIDLAIWWWLQRAN